MYEKQSLARVLLVDDESAITANLAPFLERAGYTVAIGEDGQAALTIIEQFKPDIIILDVLMPNDDLPGPIRVHESAPDDL